MTVTLDSFRDKLPEFAEVDTNVLTTFITEAEASVNTTQWAGKADDGVIYLTAHLLTLFPVAETSGVQPDPGVVTSEKEDRVSVAYGVSPKFRVDDLGTTKYGRHYLTLLGKIFVTRVF